MSRSRRNTPIRGVCADTEKKDKRLANRRLRAALRQMPADDDALEPLKREVSNVWTMDKDGKMYLGKDADPRDLRK
jgi:hypothetical protein